MDTNDSVKEPDDSTGVNGATASRFTSTGVAFLFAGESVRSTVWLFTSLPFCCPGLSTSCLFFVAPEDNDPFGPCPASFDVPGTLTIFVPERSLFVPEPAPVPDRKICVPELAFDPVPELAFVPACWRFVPEPALVPDFTTFVPKPAPAPGFTPPDSGYKASIHALGVATAFVPDDSDPPSAAAGASLGSTCENPVLAQLNEGVLLPLDAFTSSPACLSCSF
jgi:hypothetical protein